jgi:hypothetical protein
VHAVKLSPRCLRKHHRGDQRVTSLNADRWGEMFAQT